MYTIYWIARLLPWNLTKFTLINLKAEVNTFAYLQNSYWTDQLNYRTKLVRFH